MNKLEQVARALALDMYPDTRWPTDEADANSGVDDREGRHPVSWHYAQKCRSQARAAIEAMREPTDYMLKEARSAIAMHDFAVPNYVAQARSAIDAMIDAALNEK